MVVADRSILRGSRNVWRSGRSRLCESIRRDVRRTYRFAKTVENGPDQESVFGDGRYLGVIRKQRDGKYAALGEGYQRDFVFKFAAAFWLGQSISDSTAGKIG